MATMEKEVLTVKAAAYYADCSHNVITDAILKGELPVTTIGSRKKVTKTNLNKWLEAKTRYYTVIPDKNPKSTNKLKGAA